MKEDKKDIGLLFAEEDSENTSEAFNVLKTKEGMLETVLFSYASNETVRKNIILQGGGALHFIYSSPRYSHDLDFVCPELFAVDVQYPLVTELGKEIPLCEGQILKPNLKLRQRFVRVKYGHPGTDLKVKVEIGQAKAKGYGESKGKFSPLLVESPSEIYSDKILATLGRMQERGSIKPTDLFDLEYLRNNLNAQADFEEVEEKAEWYNEAGYADRPNLERAIRYILDEQNHPNFISVIRKTLLPDVFNSITIDSKYFEKCADHFRQYSTKAKSA